MTPENKLDMHEQRRGVEPDVEEIHEVVYREKTEPREGGQPLPTEMIVAAFALLLFGGWYLGKYSADFAVDRYEGPNAYAVSGELSGEQSSATGKSGPDPMLMGKRIFNNCVSCHQATGQGLAGRYPPLDGNPLVSGRADNLARIVLHGLTGPIEVLGHPYNGQMPKWSQLDDASLAAVLTYIRGSWSNQASAVEPAFVARVREQYPGRSLPWTAAELDAAPQIEPASAEPASAEPASADPAEPQTASAATIPEQQLESATATPESQSSPAR